MARLPEVSSVVEQEDDRADGEVEEFVEGLLDDVPWIEGLLLILKGLLEQSIIPRNQNPCRRLVAD